MSDSTTQTERAYFDEYVARNGAFNPFADRGWRTLRNRFVERIRPRPNESLLDVGCGTGMSRQIYRTSVGRYTGIDISPNAVATARAQFPNDHWYVGDACRLPFADQTFDLVVFSSVLHHIGDFTPAVREAYRVLKPGGRVFAYDPNLLSAPMLLFRWPKSPLYSSNGVSPNESPLMPGTLRRAFADAGFGDVLVRGQSDIPYRHVAPRLLNRLIEVFNLSDRCWETMGLGRWFGLFLITTAVKPALPSQGDMT